MELDTYVIPFLIKIVTVAVLHHEMDIIMGSLLSTVMTVQRWFLYCFEPIELKALCAVMHEAIRTKISRVVTDIPIYVPANL